MIDLFNSMIANQQQVINECEIYFNTYPYKVAHCRGYAYGCFVKDLFDKVYSYTDLSTSTLIWYSTYKGYS